MCKQTKSSSEAELEVVDVVDGLLSRAEPTKEVVAFLLAERSSGERLTSQQHSSQLNFIAIKAMMVDWSRFDLWSSV